MSARRQMTAAQHGAEVFRAADARERRRQEEAARERFGAAEYFARLFGDQPQSGAGQEHPNEPHEAMAATSPGPAAARTDTRNATGPAQGKGAGREARKSSHLPLALKHDAQGRIARKSERLGAQVQAYEYAYDNAGRLTDVRRNGQLVEQYAYDDAGRRVMSRSEAWGMRRQGLEYEGQRLSRQGDTNFYYAPDGTLHARRDTHQGNSYFSYGPHGGLTRALLPGGLEVTWQRNAQGLPLVSFVDGQAAERWTWHDLLRLVRYEDLRRELVMDFHYAGSARVPEAMVLSDGRTSHTFSLPCDQVGSIKAVADRDGNLVKTVLYDSFGNVVQDSAPHFHLPLGFAGGATDRWTGLTRFGHRDYGPRSGRFTASDPLGDTGGDHDLYEYCEDDPINAVDPFGLDSNPLETLKNGARVMKGINGAGKVIATPDFEEAADDAIGSIRKATQKMDSAGIPSEDNWEEYENHPAVLGQLFKKKGGKALETGGKIARP